MSCNSMSCGSSGIFAFGNNWWWIILLIIIVLCWGNTGCGNTCGCGSNNCGCGNSNDCGCC